MAKRIDVFMDNFEPVPVETPVDTSDPAGAPSLRERIHRPLQPVGMAPGEIGAGVPEAERLEAERARFLESRRTVTGAVKPAETRDTQSIVDAFVPRVLIGSPSTLDVTGADRQTRIERAVADAVTTINDTRTVDLPGNVTPIAGRAPLYVSDYNPDAPESRDREVDPSILTALDSTRLSTNVVGNTGAELKRVTITPFRITVWRRTEPGQLLNDLSKGSSADISLPRGRYVLTFRGVRAAGLSHYATDEPFVLNIGGKHQVVEKIIVNPDDDTAQIQIQITENLIPLLLVATAAVGVTGWAFWTAGDALDSLDRVIVDTTGALTPVIVVGALGLAVWWLWPKLKGTRQ